MNKLRCFVLIFATIIRCFCYDKEMLFERGDQNSHQRMRSIASRLRPLLALTIAIVPIAPGIRKIDTEATNEKTIRALPPMQNSRSAMQTLQPFIKPQVRKTRFSLNGIASWYGAVLDGHLTASGERFDMHALTACHPDLPFNTLVKVINLRNRRSVIVRVNDRGVLSAGRVIDLSFAAAEDLDMVKAGVSPVSLQVISLGRGKS